jgi:O-antigen/teichoic acid export membrane protein
MRNSQFLRHNAVFLAGSVAVGALNYLYYPVLGRLLEPGAFGEVQTLVSLFLQLGIFLMVLSMVIVNIVANYHSEARRNTFVFEFEKLALLAGLALLAASVVFGRQLQAWLNFESSWPFALLALAVVASVPFYIRGAFLRGHQRFGLVSLGQVLAAGGKLAVSAALVLLGLGTVGAISGVVVAQAAACMLVAWWAYRTGLKPLLSAKKASLPDFKLLAPELRYGGVVLAASLAITLQYSIDILVIKHYFDATTAGLYAGVAAVARILFFLTASIAQVLISKVRVNDGRGENGRTLQRSLLLLGAMSLPVLAVMVAFPSQIIGLLMGSTYSGMADLLPKLSISVFIVAVINLLAAYYLALRQYGIALLAAVGAGFTYLFIYLHHGSPTAVVESLLLGSIATMTAIGVWILTNKGAPLSKARP